MSFKSANFDISDNMSPHASDAGVMSGVMYARFKTLIETQIGIRLSAYGREQLSYRLQKRLKEIGISSFDSYYDFLISPAGQDAEVERLIESVVIHKTEFFRHVEHFHYLTQTALPAIAASKGAKRCCRIWCAGCSTGQEAYSLTMLLSEFAAQHLNFRFSVLATDVSSKVLHHAQRGIYDEELIEAIPVELRKKYLLKGRKQHKNKVRFSHELRSTIHFEKLNFHKATYDISNRQDVIFCRNVLIYFARSIQETILNRLCRCLRPNGYLFLGPSETLNGMTLPLVRVAARVYQKLPDASD